jgi:MarR family transcriptional regulator, organic hydroperoxide resistance regulator
VHQPLVASVLRRRYDRPITEIIDFPEGSCVDQTDDAVSECLDEQLCFAAYTLSHAFTRRYRHALEGLGLTYPRRLAVAALARGASPTMTELARELHMDYGTLTPMLKLLERDGIVVRERNDNDERIVRVRLTDAGEALAVRAQEAMAAVAGSTGRTQKELAPLVAALIAIRENLERDNKRLDA